jgi:hypothetical protein
LGVNAPLIKVKRHYYDVIEHNKEITEKIQFIESLTHDSYIVQIPHLALRYKTDLEHLLSIFDQHYITQDHHILNVKEENFPKKYRQIIRKLQQAVVEPSLRKTMDIEDEILEELQDKERLIAGQEKLINEKDKALAEKDKEKELAIAEKEREKELAIAEKDNELAEKDNELAEKDKKTVINALQSGIDIKTIALITQLSRDTIQEIIKEINT